MSDEKKSKISWVKSPSGIPEYYANMLHLMWSLDDVRIRLGHLVESSETPNPGPDFRAVSEETAAITISWRNAKVLRNQLIAVVEAYEKTNGEIKIEIALAPTPD